MRIERKQLTSPSLEQPNEKPNAVMRLYQNTLGRVHWLIWVMLLAIASGGIGYSATYWLVKLPSTPDCPRIFWPIASASMRLECASLEAEKETVEGYLAAIALVEVLPKDHPLRAQINSQVEDWAVGILNIAEKEIDEGKLEEAIATARQIPNNVQAYGVVDSRIKKWQATWTEGEGIYNEVQRSLKASDWSTAFREAVKLLYLDSKYWSTTKYTEITEEIKIAQEESSKLDNAFLAMKRGGIDNWLKAVEDAEKISSNSYAYEEAQGLIAKAKTKIVEQIENAIDLRDWDTLLNMTDRLPESIASGDRFGEWQTMGNAGADANLGTIESLESAILTAQEIKPSSPLYKVAQKEIERWKLEIQDVALLEKARETGRSGLISDLNAAIAQAELISPSNPRYSEAREEISRWVAQVQTIEDQPLLDRAEEIAVTGTVPALQQAISQASAIGQNRALYSQAQDRISQWQNIIEEQEDRPFLEQALALASGKEYAAAIEAAEQIGRGRALYSEARLNIEKWQQEIQASSDYQEAVLVAEPNTADSLVSAIGIVRSIPTSTDVGVDRTQALNRWSYQLLGYANDLANRSLLQQAIELAKSIPSDSAAYQSAREQIKSWQEMLQPKTSPLAPNSPSLLETNFGDREQNN
jgi:uncharacterized protein (UPF0548 family)